MSSARIVRAQASLTAVTDYVSNQRERKMEVWMLMMALASTDPEIIGEPIPVEMEFETEAECIEAAQYAEKLAVDIGGVKVTWTCEKQ
jgi:hypothetical protein